MNDDRQRAIDVPEHELVRAFAKARLPLCRILVEMLNENVLHRTERRGCGFTQATRFLAALVNEREFSARMGGGLVRVGLERKLGRSKLLERFAAERDGLVNSLELSESRLLASMIFEIVARDASGRSLGLAAEEKLPIGTCPLAEQYFLEVAYNSIRRGGIINVVYDADQTPLLLEKCGLGDNHSSISVAPVVLNGVNLPLGSLVGLDRDQSADSSYAPTRNGRGRLIPLSHLRSVRFLRLTTLAVEPSARKRAFTTHFDQQVRGGLFSPDTTRIEQLVEFAQVQAS